VADLAHCKTCNAEIYWARTEKGALSPVDAEPDPEGQWVLAMRGKELRVLKYDPSKHGPQWKRRTSHFATCAQADQHRKPR
jgi:hypothetical protein